MNTSQFLLAMIAFYHKFKQFQMNTKLLILILTALFLQATTMSLTKHDEFSNACFYFPAGNTFETSTFNYTITQAWTSAQVPQLQSGALNASDFIDVKGWLPYTTRSAFFLELGNRGRNILTQLDFVKNVTVGSDAPGFGLSTQELQFAYGSPSKAKLYKVPSGKGVKAVRFQVSATNNSYLGKWSIITEMVDIADLQIHMRVEAQRVQDLINKNHLTSQDVASALNIIPPFVESSLFWTFKTSPAKGTNAPVSYQAFVVTMREGESVLAGPIHNGQPGLMLAKDLVKSRGCCV